MIRVGSVRIAKSVHSLCFGLSWTFLFSFPLMVVIQEVAAEIGRVTGRGIARNLRRRY